MIFVGDVELSKGTSEKLINHLSIELGEELTEEDLQFYIDSKKCRIYKDHEIEHPYSVIPDKRLILAQITYYLQVEQRYFGKTIWENIAQLEPDENNIICYIKQTFGFGKEAL